MKCYELAKCTPEQQEKCYVWNSFRDNPDDFENIKCWVLKSVHHQENRDLLKKCLKCRYYLMMNRDTGLVSDFDADIAKVSCEGVINNDKTRAILEVWEKLKESKKSKVILDLSSVNNIYSCGLGMLVKVHKEAEEAGGLMVVVGAQGYVLASFESTKLSRLLKLAGDNREAREIFDTLKKKKEEAVVRKEPGEKPRQRPPCWEYWNNHNPGNATTCDECFKKINPSQEPCWIVEGMIEGVSFQYVNEDCESCDFFLEFGVPADS
ncbi:MAG: STAS domain-containing protein [Chitinivibrionales bacterium]|nr:STAS domain-containing protein [Chitinivibrionales bacterium]